MTGKTHAAVGVATTAAILMLNPQGFELWDMHIIPAISLVTAATGSYLPDIDIHQSTMGQRHKFISKRLKHRGFTHTLVIPILLLALMQFITFLLPGAILGDIINSLLFGLDLGWVLHIFADLFNRKGVPLFYPVSKAHVHIAAVKTRHFSEYVWLGLFLICLAGFTMYKGGYL